MKIKKIILVLSVTMIIIISGIIIPLIINGDSNSAQTAQVLKEKTFTSELVGVAVQGTMKNFSDTLVTKTIAADKKGVSTVALDPGYYDSIQIDASAVYDAGVAAGQVNSTKKVGGPYSGNTSINVSSYIKSGDTANNFIIEFLGNSDTYTEKDTVSTHPDLAGHLAASVPSKSLSGNTLTVSGMQTKLYLWTSSWGDLRVTDVNYSYNVWYKP